MNSKINLSFSNIFKLISFNLNNIIKTHVLLLCIIVLFSGCDNSDSTNSGIPTIIDNDRDGFEQIIDCNDNNPFTYPGAPEIGDDDVDNNCNGTRDEEEIVEFSDDNFKKSVIDSLQLNKKVYDDIYNYELCKLNSLIASGSEIAGIKGIEYANNIVDLDLSNNMIDELSPLIQNPGIKGRDVYVNIDHNSLDEGDCSEIQTLVNRDIHINYDVPCEVFIDMDGDGFWRTEDCDDTDKFSYPGAPELGLDDKDNNCNGTRDEDEIVIFNEFRLKNKVIEVLKANHGIEKESSDDIYNYEIAEIKTLELSKLFLKNINGLEYAYNLEKLNLENNKVTDLSPINGLKKLEELNLYNNNLSEISPLAGLNSLTRLNLSKNNLSNVSSLKKINKLKALYLSENKIFNLYDLKGKHDLSVLHLDKNLISDILPLEKLTALTELKLQNNIIEDISPLKDLTQLEYLELSNNKIEEIDPLSGLVNLKTFIAENNSIDGIESLEGLTKLEYLNLDKNDIYYVDELRECTELTFLSMETNGVWDLTPLYSLKKLETVNLKDNYVEEINGLEENVNLKKLDLEINYIDDLSLFTKFINLEDLNLDDNNLRDISPIRDMTSLIYLSLEENKIRVIDALSSLVEVKKIHLKNNNISDISPLEFVINIEILDLDGNPISDIKPLVNNPGLSGRQDKVYLRNSLLDLDDCEDIKKLSLKKIYFFRDKDLRCN